MTRPTKIIVNCETNESVEVEFTDEEMAQLELDKIETEARRKEQETEREIAAQIKASADAKLAALGLSAEEIKAITG